MDVRPLADADRATTRAWIRERWGDDAMVGHGELFHPADHEGFVAGEWGGLVTYRVAGDGCEITLIEAATPGAGAGSALLSAVIDEARGRGCARVWLVTTNDNLHARSWYARRGFTVVAVRAGAVDRARETLKPSIATHNDENGLPISDEIELALSL